MEQVISTRATNSSISATTSSSTVALPSSAVSSNSVIVYNAGPNDAFITTSVGAGTATTANYPIGAGQTQPFSKPPSDNYGSAICATGTATVYFISDNYGGF